MKRIRRRLASAATLALVAFPLAAAPGQSPVAPQLTPEQAAARTAAMAKIRTASETDRQHMLTLLGLKDPAPLGPTSTDPTRRP